MNYKSTTSIFRFKNVVALVFLSFLLIIGCSDTMQQEDSQYPRDFNFVFNYGVQNKNQLDTFNNTYTKDLIQNGTKKIRFRLTEEEKEIIYKKMNEIDLFSYPKYNEGMTFEPTSGFHFVVQHNGEKQTIAWNGGIRENPTDQKFGSLVRLVIEIIESHKEYKALPQAEGGYL
jgi:hypothetical protein